ncbi:hypothetical protein [Pedobacter rhizosphaerae]|uniref:DUF5007 domain-containing protein n=1 Tax=Pedobacter rhizosphaerae TaxID=390241 RepID=A0A1H9MSD3_9SPHI|nr:hypothetical protein [Pedobacter rhizosphaerae]SER26335.1 hypothetical protein SAMN04488023_106112 [Pedobacter rhizosphaerae]
MKKIFIISSLSVLALMGILFGCKKVSKGFISDYMYYTPNPLIATQGNVVNSKAIELDGTTGPVTVKLLAVRNMDTGQPAPDMLKEFTIKQFLGQITSADSTVALVNKKIVLKPALPLEVSEIGGRISLSQATANVATGNYVIDVRVSNVKGTRDILNACRIQLLPKAHFALDAGPFFTTSDPDTETGFSGQSPLPVTITYDNKGPNKIRFVFLDKNGATFDPSAGQVVTRGDRGNFSQMNPYFPVVRTNTALEWEFIDLPNGFPIKDGNNGTGNYYRIPARFTVENRNANPVFFGFKALSAGSYTVTIQIPAITKKP